MLHDLKYFITFAPLINLEEMEKSKNSFIHNIEVQLRFNDFDVLGHVNNAIHQHYFDLARLNYFNEVIKDELKWEDFSVIMASIKIDYKNPVLLNEPVSIRSRISILGEKSITMVQEVYNPITGEDKSCNIAVMAGYSSKTKQTESIPKHWVEKISEFENDVKYKY